MAATKLGRMVNSAFMVFDFTLHENNGVVHYMSVLCASGHYMGQTKKSKNVSNTFSSKMVSRILTQ